MRQRESFDEFRTAIRPFRHLWNTLEISCVCIQNEGVSLNLMTKVVLEYRGHGGDETVYKVDFPGLKAIVAIRSADLLDEFLVDLEHGEVTHIAEFPIFYSSDLPAQEFLYHWYVNVLPKGTWLSAHKAIALHGSGKMMHELIGTYQTIQSLDGRVRKETSYNGMKNLAGELGLQENFDILKHSSFANVLAPFPLDVSSVVLKSTRKKHVAILDLTAARSVKEEHITVKYGAMPASARKWTDTREEGSVRQMRTKVDAPSGASPTELSVFYGPEEIETLSVVEGSSIPVRKVGELVLFTGAGASRALDLPTTKEFFKEVKDAIPDNISGAFNNIVSSLYGAGAKTENVDVELVLGLTDDVVRFSQTSGGRFLTDAHPHQSIIRPMFAEVKMVDEWCKQLVFDNYAKFNEQDVARVYGDLLDVLGRYASLKTLPILTTNYDRTIETLMRSETRLNELFPGNADQVVFEDGFPRNEPPERGWDIGNYSDLRRTGSGTIIQYFKLHGSLGWQKYDDRVVDAHVPDFAGDLAKHVLLYPGYKASAETEPFESLHKKLEEFLSTYSVCVVIGFSFRDNRINGIMSTCLEQNRDLRILVLLPKIPDDPESKLVDLARRFNTKRGKRIIHVPGKFGEAGTLEKLTSELQKVATE